MKSIPSQRISGARKEGNEMNLLAGIVLVFLASVLAPGVNEESRAEHFQSNNPAFIAEDHAPCVVRWVRRGEERTPATCAIRWNKG